MAPRSWQGKVPRSAGQFGLLVLLVGFATHLAQAQAEATAAAGQECISAARCQTSGQEDVWSRRNGTGPGGSACQFGVGCHASPGFAAAGELCSKGRAESQAPYWGQNHHTGTVGSVRKRHERGLPQRTSTAPRCPASPQRGDGPSRLCKRAAEGDLWAAQVVMWEEEAMPSDSVFSAVLQRALQGSTAPSEHAGTPCSSTTRVQPAPPSRPDRILLRSRGLLCRRMFVGARPCPSRLQPFPPPRHLAPVAAPPASTDPYLHPAAVLTAPGSGTGGRCQNWRQGCSEAEWASPRPQCPGQPFPGPCSEASSVHGSAWGCCHDCLWCCRCAFSRRRLRSCCRCSPTASTGVGLHGVSHSAAFGPLTVRVVVHLAPAFCLAGLPSIDASCIQCSVSSLWGRTQCCSVLPSWRFFFSVPRTLSRGILSLGSSFGLCPQICLCQLVLNAVAALFSRRPLSHFDHDFGIVVVTRELWSRASLGYPCVHWPVTMAAATLRHRGWPSLQVAHVPAASVVTASLWVAARPADHLLARTSSRPASGLFGWLVSFVEWIACFGRSFFLLYLLALFRLLLGALPLRRQAPLANTTLRVSRRCLRGAPLLFVLALG